MNKTIPYLDLQSLQSRFKSEDQKTLNDFIDAGFFIGGPLVQQFEKQFADYCGVDHCIGTGNGLDALTIILRAEIALGNLPENARVLVPANTYIATWLSIHLAGLTIVPVDVEELNLSLSALESFHEDYDAIMCVDLYGKLVEDEVYAFAKARNIPIYTDTAQSHGAKNSSGKRSGSLARASAFSFYPTKNLGALGDGGAIVTNDKNLAQACRKIANYGRDSRFENKYKGVNSRLDPLQAGFLSTRLQQLDADNECRAQIAKLYYDKISNPKIGLLKEDFLQDNAFHVFPVFVEEREHFQDYLETNGIGHSCHYPKPPHQQEAFSNFNNMNFPVTERFHEREVSIPCNPLITSQEAERIIEILNNYS